jgi:hypothetical protein
VIGLVGVTSDSNVIVRAANKINKMRLKSLVGPITVEEHVESGILSASFVRIYLAGERGWLENLAYSVPFNFFVSPVKTISEKTFYAVAPEHLENAGF